MSDLEDLRRKHEEMGRTIAELEGKEKQPMLKRGQLWKHKLYGEVYIVHMCGPYENPEYRMVAIYGEGVGEKSCDSRDFYWAGEKFEYLGMANDLLTIKG